MAFGPYISPGAGAGHLVFNKQHKASAPRLAGKTCRLKTAHRGFDKNTL
jgi:hypothetical protein